MKKHRVPKSTRSASKKLIDLHSNQIVLKEIQKLKREASERKRDPRQGPAEAEAYSAMGLPGDNSFELYQCTASQRSMAVQTPRESVDSGRPLFDRRPKPLTNKALVDLR